MRHSGGSSIWLVLLVVLLVVVIVGALIGIRRRRRFRSPYGEPLLAPAAGSAARLQRHSRTRATERSAPDEAADHELADQEGPAVAGVPDPAEPTELDVAHEPVMHAVNDTVGVSDPLQSLSLEILFNGGVPTDTASPSPDEAHPGDPAYRLGIMFYERGLVDGAAAAWRRAAAMQHPGAAIRLGMMREERGDLEGARDAYREAERWGDPDAGERAAQLPHLPES